MGIEKSIRRVECYDISNIQGDLSVASRVVFEDGDPEPSLYRRYKIRTVTGADDFASMLEVLRRRFRPTARRDPLPDLVLVDGGKGQISSARKALEEMGVEVGLAGLAKGRRRGDHQVPERVFIPGRSSPLDLPADGPESLFLQRVRDEAHRFANRYHRELRRKRALTTGLEEIPGVGVMRRRALLEHFGSLRELKQAALEEIIAVPGMTRETARSTYRFLHPEDEPTTSDG
jgi:excinuclease ABC subunit C